MDESGGKIVSIFLGRDQVFRDNNGVRLTFK